MSEDDAVIKRIYDDPSDDDGHRVLVDRLWPRGMSKQRAAIDEWCKTVAPSTDLRKWYAHDPVRFDEFRARYADELADGDQASAFAHLRDLHQHGRLTLLTASKALDISEARVLADLLNEGTLAN